MFVTTGDDAGRQAAIEAKAAGKSPIEIWDQTGWFEGPDGELRREIPDMDASLDMSDMKEGEIVKLDEVFDHPELFEAMPELRDVDFQLWDSANGPIFDDPEILGVYATLVDKVVVRDRDDLRSALHEIQHATDQHQGLDSGANAGMMSEEEYMADIGERAAFDVMDRMDGSTEPPDLMDLDR